MDCPVGYECSWYITKVADLNPWPPVVFWLGLAALIALVAIVGIVAMHFYYKTHR